jgi:hypothetical protein
VKTNQALVLGAIIGLFVQGCASAKVGKSDDGSGGSGGDPQGGKGGSGGEGGSGGGGGPLIDLDAHEPPPDTKKADLAPDVTPFGYDDKGNALCLSILSLGQPASYGKQSGTGDNTDAFQTFMNTYTKNANTGTTTKMTMVKKFTSLTEDFLSKYNVVVLQALEDSEWTGLWTFSQSDVDVLKKWVTEKGGALITMTGYGGNTTEVDPLNKLLSFTGISYNTDDIFNSCPDNMCYCADNSVAFNGWQSSYTDAPLLTHDLKKVGVFHGRSIKCTASDCQVFAKDSSGNKIGVAKIMGNGRVIAWADEWVTYTSQWGLTDAEQDDVSKYSQCAGYTAKTSYSVPQFWYNIFYWAVPSAQWCFTITVPPTADPGQGIIY